MPRRLVQDKAAKADLIEIWIYSFQASSEAQADRYLTALERCIGMLARHAESGRQRDEIREGYWSMRVEHHVVFYTLTDAEVRIRRVLHGAMDPGRHL